MRVHERIHLVNDRFTSVYILLHDKPCLIDTGLPKTPETRVFPYLNHLGRDPKDIAFVVLTHGHGDHYGGLPAVKRVSEAKVAVHELDAPLIEVAADAALLRQLHATYPEAFGPFRGKVTRLPKADILLRNGDEVNLAGVEVEVVHTPGHSPGAICLHQRDERTLFTGDSVQGQALLLYGEVDDYIQSIRRLTELKLDLLLAAHPYPPARDAVMDGDGAKLFLVTSLKTVENCLEKVAEGLKSSRHPLSVQEVAVVMQGTPIITIIRILEKLMREGRVEKAEAGPVYRWVN